MEELSIFLALAIALLLILLYPIFIDVSIIELIEHSRRMLTFGKLQSPQDGNVKIKQQYQKCVCVCGKGAIRCLCEVCSFIQKTFE